jgi:hypothetical protein
MASRPGALSLFPQRVAWVDADGYLTPEAQRALKMLFTRVGGAMGDMGDDVFQPFVPSFDQGGYSAEVYQLPNVPAESLPEVFQLRSYDYELSLKEDKANKDASGGYVGKTGQSINFTNVAGTFVSGMSNTNTAARSYAFPDRNITVAGLDDITGGLNNFSAATGYLAAGIAGVTATIDVTATPNLQVQGGIIIGATP